MPLHADEVAKHNNKDSCWVIIHGEAFDVTEFMPEHPGGMGIILKYAGKDATEAYDPIHPPGTIQTYLPKDKFKGAVDVSTLTKVVKQQTEEDKQLEIRRAAKPPLETCLNLYDFEAVAKTTLTAQAWAYYSSGADDEITMRENRTAYQRIWFRPRILKDVTTVDYSTTLLGTKSTLPIYITATALGKLGHADGELNLTKAGAKHGIIQMIPTLASCSFEEIVDAAAKDQVQWMQLYVNKDREITKKIVQKAEQRGIKGLFVTVDAPQLGRREKDMRMKFADEGSRVQQGDASVDKSQGAARAISSFIDPGLCWNDVPWLKSITKMPIILKGVQCWEDAVLAAEYGCQGVVLSNHGGRQLDFARSGIEILAEVVRELKQRGLWGDHFQVFIDGGVRRAGDVIKAVCLGAKGVGVGRAFLYAYSAYGHEGVSRAIQILKDEFEMNMRLIGAPTLADLNPSMVDISQLSNRGIEAPADYLFKHNYEPLPALITGGGIQAKL